MSEIVNPLIVDYIRKVLPESKDLLKEMEQYAAEHNVPIIQPEVAKLLEVIVMTKGAARILEIGTAIGYSAIILSNAMNDGHLTTIERNRQMVDIALANIESAGLSERIRVIEGDAKDVLTQVNDRFDLIFLDAAKGHYTEFYQKSIGMLKKGGILVSDNVLYKAMVASDDYVEKRKKTIVKRMRTYVDQIMNDERFTSCLLPIGDGVIISYCKREA